jgi:hypothetical protein
LSGLRGQAFFEKETMPVATALVITRAEPGINEQQVPITMVSLPEVYFFILTHLPGIFGDGSLDVICRPVSVRAYIRAVLFDSSQ